MTPERLPPPSLDVRIAPDVLVRDRGLLLCGGTPFRIVRLSAAGARVAARWHTGGPVGERLGERALARRLLDAGVLLTAPGEVTAAAQIEIVVPVRDRLPELRRCLAALTEHSSEARIVVVDDGSARPNDVAEIAKEHGAAIVRHVLSRGPAAARNAGLAATTAPLVAFVDSDVVVDRECIERLTMHFDDPAVGAAAPRVLALAPPRTTLGRYESEHSSLDMGATAASVGPGRPVSYVPSTTLIVRRDAVPGSFDEALHVGEDVDFIWRLVGRGWRVAYDPVATVRHDHRVRPGAFWRRRWDYAHSIGPLARRHPRALPAVYLDPSSAGIIGLLLLRRPLAAGLLAAVRATFVRRQIARTTAHPSALGVDLLARTLLGTTRGVCHAVRRTWSPALLLAAPWSTRARAALGLAVLVSVADGRPRTTDVPLWLADDLVAALGTSAGCLTARTVRPLLPGLVGTHPVRR